MTPDQPGLLAATRWADRAATEPHMGPIAPILAELGLLVQRGIDQVGGIEVRRQCCASAAQVAASRRSARIQVAPGAKSHPGGAGAKSAARRRTEAQDFATGQLLRFGIAAGYLARRPKQTPYDVQRKLSIALAFGDGARVLMPDQPAAGLGGDDMERLVRV